MTLKTGDSLGRYQIVARLGSGAMATVYKAYLPSLDRTVALKVLRVGLADDDPLARERFEFEAKSVAKLRHPNVVGLFDFDDIDGQTFIVMEYLDGATLKARLRDLTAAGQRMPIGDVASVISGVAAALSYAHAKGLVHRDVKPSNIMLPSDGRAVLTDFGIAKMLSAIQSPRTQTGVGVGTAAYMAPEQAEGGEITGAADTYALGVVAYEALTGRVPFIADAPLAVLLAHLKDPVHLPTALRADIGHATEAALLRALAKKPEHRYPSTSEFGDAFMHAVGIGLPAPASSPQLPRSLDPQPANLPAQLTSFVGRDSERIEIAGMLELHQLLTLTGPPGSGKTRLAIQIAGVVLPAFKDGVFFVPLAPISDPSLVGSVIAQILGVKEEAREPVAQSLLDHLRAKAILLILDNFEQVVPAAPLLGDLLAACPSLKMLVTSQVPLRLSAEQQFGVPPLSLQQPRSGGSESARSDAVGLFVQRALAVEPRLSLAEADLAAIGEICARLEGLPLSIELAAARSKLLSPRAMLPLLRSRLSLLTGGASDTPKRQQSLRATLAWSYELLGAEERTLFSRLAVFAGGCTLTSAEAVCAPGLSFSILDGLSALVDHSLLRHEVQPDGAPRFFMLETIREYAQERLDDSGEAAAVRFRHAQEFLTLAEAAEPELFGPNYRLWCDRLAVEHDNMRASLNILVSTGRIELALNLSGALSRFWEIRSYWKEGLGRLEPLLKASASASPVARARAVTGAGVLAWRLGDLDRAGELLEEGAALFAARGDTLHRARALGRWAWVSALQGENSRAVSLAEETQAAAAQAHDNWALQIVADTLGAVALARGDYARGEAAFSEGVALARQMGLPRGVASGLGNLGFAMLLQGRYQEAEAALSEALRVAREIGEPNFLADARVNLAILALHNGDIRRAASFVRESLAVAVDMHDGLLIANCLRTVGSLASVHEAFTDGARLWGAAEAQYERSGAPIAAYELAAHERYVASARSNLGEAKFAAAWEEGRRRPWEIVISEATASADRMSRGDP